MSNRFFLVIVLLWSFACFAAGAGLAGWYYGGKVSQLKSGIEKCTLKNADFKSAAELQNAAIISLNDFAAKQAGKYQQLLLQPEKVRFETKYIEVKSNECSDIKNIIDDIRAVGF